MACWPIFLLAVHGLLTLELVWTLFFWVRVCLYITYYKGISHVTYSPLRYQPSDKQLFFIHSEIWHEIPFSELGVIQ